MPEDEIKQTDYNSADGGGAAWRGSLLRKTNRIYVNPTVYITGDAGGSTQLMHDYEPLSCISVPAIYHCPLCGSITTKPKLSTCPGE